MQLKRKDLIKLLVKNGFVFIREGGNHDIYRRGQEQEAVARHAEIPEMTARKIIKRRGLK